MSTKVIALVYGAVAVGLVGVLVRLSLPPDRIILGLVVVTILALAGVAVAFWRL